MTGETEEEIETSRKLNRVCREQMKSRLLHDILIDLNVCNLEGWDMCEYIKELREMICNIYQKTRKGKSRNCINIIQSELNFES